MHNSKLLRNASATALFLLQEFLRILKMWPTYLTNTALNKIHTICAYVTMCQAKDFVGDILVKFPGFHFEDKVVCSHSQSNSSAGLRVDIWSPPPTGKETYRVINFFDATRNVVRVHKLQSILLELSWQSIHRNPFKVYKSFSSKAFPDCSSILRSCVMHWNEDWYGRAENKFQRAAQQLWYSCY